MEHRSAREASLHSTRARVAEHVVYRRFPHETVVLNLDSGQYHGLNPVAGDMLDAMADSECLNAAAERIAADYDHPLPVVAADLVELCDALTVRGLIRVEPVLGG
jgi:hypothetical protein